MKHFVGIDPGKKGGLVALSSSGKIVDATAMPETELLIADWFQFFQCRAVIEKVHSMPGQGVASMFTFGRGYGFLRGCLHCHEIPFDEVNPQAWQKELGIPPRNKKSESNARFKMRLLEKAQQLFPTYELWKEPRAKGKQLSVCDALLIAEYCRRIYK